MQPSGVIVYEDTNYQGKGELFVGDDLNNLNGNRVGDDAASSFKFLRYNLAGCVRFWSDVGLQGSQQCFCWDDEPNPWGSSGWVSSLEYG